jgi:hypothetical protein
MIILKLRAGLGNQLFQYAYARALALRSKAALTIDLNWFSNIAPGDTPRVFLLNKYNLPQSVHIADHPNPPKAVQLFRKIKAKVLREIFKYSDHAYYPRLAKAVPTSKDVEVEGFWNTEKYFKDCENVIRAELTLKAPLGVAASKSESKLKELGKTNTLVLLHVRRGDYVSNAGALKHHGLSGLDYYVAAIKLMNEKLGVACAARMATTATSPSAAVTETSTSKPLFVLASDDMDWVRENIIPLLNGAPYEILSNPTEIKDYEEIYLMSLCKHFIIANSSFSWWGAWLSSPASANDSYGEKGSDGVDGLKGSEKIVIGPKRWVANPGVDTSDALPDRWIKL